jgi:hypothetical protein
MVPIKGTQVTEGLDANVLFEKAVEGYIIQVSKNVSEDFKTYLDLTSKNFHNGVVHFDPEKTGVDFLYFEHDTQAETLEVNIEDKTICCEYKYVLGDDAFKTYLNYFTSQHFLDFMDSRSDNDPDVNTEGNITNINCKNKDIFIGINLNGDDNSISINQMVNGIEQI